MRRQLHRAIAVVLIAGLFAVGYRSLWAEGPEPGDPPPQAEHVPTPEPIDGSPVFHDLALKLATQFRWRPPTKDELRARGKLDAEGQIVQDTLGQQTTFWAYDFQTGTYYQFTATLQRIGVHAYVYVENGQSISGTVLDNIVTEFDNTIYASNTTIFGNEPNPGIDGDTRITILLLNIRDPYYYGYGNVYVAGYYTSADEYPQSWISHSNEREMFYMDVSPATPGSQSFYGTLAHEFQHMIHWNHDPYEETWINEGLSDLAIFRAGYGHPSSHVSRFLQAPDTALTTWGGQLADYGAAYLWSLYLWEKFGGDATITTLVDEGSNGITGINDMLAARGYGDTFADIFPRWPLANYLDDTSIGSAPFFYGYTNLDLLAEFFHPTAAGLHSSYPVASTAAAVNVYATDYVLFTGASGDLQLAFNGDDAGQFAAYAVGSSSSSFAAGTNAVMPISLDAGKDGTAVLAGFGSTYNRAILAVLNPSGGATESYTYQAATVTVVSDTLSLANGWNLVGLPLTPADLSIDATFAPIYGHLQAVTTFSCQQAAASYYPGDPQSTLATVDGYHGYWIKTDVAATLTITGTLVSTSTVFSLCSGWNLVPFLPSTAAPLTTALAGLGTSYAAVLGYDHGPVTYYRQVPAYMNTLTDMQPGKAYWIYMDQPSTLSFSGL